MAEHLPTVWKRRSILLLCFGVFLYAFLYLLVASLLPYFLEDLFTRKTDCESIIKKARIQIFPLRLVLEGVSVRRKTDRLTEGVYADRVQAGIKWSALFKKRLIVKKTEVYGLYFNSVGKDSAFFRTLDFLIQPPRRHKKKDPGWRVSVPTIDITTSQREGSGPILILDNMRLNARNVLVHLDIPPGEPPTVISFTGHEFTMSAKGKQNFFRGNIGGLVSANSRQVIVKQLRLLKGKDVLANASGKVLLKPVARYLLKFSANSRSTEISEIFEGAGIDLDALPFKVTVDGDIAGALASPELKGRLNLEFPEEIPLLQSAKCSPRELSAHFSYQGVRFVLDDFRVDDLVTIGDFKLQYGKESTFSMQARLNLESSTEFAKRCLNNKSQIFGLDGTALFLAINNSRFSDGTFSLKGKFYPLIITGDIAANSGSRGHLKTELTLDNSILSLKINEKVLAAYTESEAMNSADLSLSFNCDLQNVAQNGLHINAPSLKVDNYPLKRLVQIFGPFASTRSVSSIIKVASRATLDLKGAFTAKGLWPETGELKVNLKDLGKSKLKTDVETVMAFTPKVISIPKLLINHPMAKMSSSGKIYKSGKIELSSLVVNNGNDFVKADRPVLAKFKEGTLDLKDVRLEVAKQYIDISGKLDTQKGWDLSIASDWNLGTTELVTDEVEHITGKVQSRLELKGPPSYPQLYGRVDLENFSTIVPVGTSIIDISGLSAHGVFDGESLSIVDSAGKMGAGSMKLSGEIQNLFSTNYRAVKLGIKLENAQIEPLEDLSMVFGADLAFSKLGKDPFLISGDITVSEGSYEKFIDLPAVLATLRNYILGKSNDRKGKLATKTVDVNLDLNLKAPSGIIVDTNILRAELGGFFDVTGNVSEPKIEGKIEALQGSFGFYPEQFELLSGKLSFLKTSSSLDPRLDIIGDTTLVTPTGESDRVQLFISGTLTRPELTFASDLGLDDKEVIRLLAAENKGWTIIRKSQAGRKLGDLLNPSTDLSISERISGITGFEKVELEPKFSQTTGSITPGVSARRPLSKNINLELKSELSRQQASELTVDYDVTPEVSLFTGWQTRSITRGTSSRGGNFQLGIKYRRDFFGKGLWPEFSAEVTPAGVR